MPYLTGAVVLVVLAVGSTAPGLLAFVIGRFAQVFPDYRERVLRHEAAHFLVSIVREGDHITGKMAPVLSCYAFATGSLSVWQHQTVSVCTHTGAQASKPCCLHLHGCRPSTVRQPSSIVGAAGGVSDEGPCDRLLPGHWQGPH